ncbi:hypothetical protein AZE42_08631, partial [Rhizopogon vesiculosus]
MIFLDQPINTGYSYSNDGTNINSSPVAGKDVYAFMELFLSRFPEYSTQPFHIAAESYGGTIAPHIANVIYTENKKIPVASSGLVKINLASVILGNGMTDASTCQRMIKACDDFDSWFTCVPATLYCYFQLYAPVRQSGLNPFDARIQCDHKKDGPLCYRQMGWIETYLNEPEVKAALGVNPRRNFKPVNEAVLRAFLFRGDWMHNTPLLLKEMINDGLRLLVYAGNADMMCNYMGNERWVEQLDTVFLDEFSTAPTEQWVTMNSRKMAGTVRSAGGAGSGAGNVTFVTVHEA